MCSCIGVLVATAVTIGCGALAHRTETPIQVVPQWAKISEIAAPSGELSVLAAEPHGRVHSDSAINIVFSHPMRSLAMAEDYPLPPIEIEPPLPGQWQWVGTNAVTRVGASAALVPATRYRVKVSGLARDLAGRQLGMPYFFEFETERPQLLRVDGTTSALGKRLRICHGKERDGSEPSYTGPDVFDGATLRPDSHIAAIFNLPVDPSAIRDALTIAAEPLSPGVGMKVDAIAFDAKSPCPDEPNIIELTPRQPLPRASHIVVKAKANLKSTLGPLDAEVDHEPTEGSRIETYPPLTATVSYTPKDGGLEVTFSTPVQSKRANRLTTIQPWVPLTRRANSEFIKQHPMGFIAKPGNYAVRIRPEIKDIYGQSLTGPLQWTIVVAPPPPPTPQLFIGASSGFIDPGQPQWVKFASKSISQLTVKTVPLSPADIIDKLIADSSERPLQDFLSQRRGKEVHFAPALRDWTGGISLFDALQPSHYGAFGLRIEGNEGSADAVYLHPTNLAMTTLQSSEQVLVWVTRLSDARPVAHAKLTLHRVDTNEALGETGSDGIAVIDAAASAKLLQSGKFSILVAEQGSDWAYVTGDKIVAPAPWLNMTGALFVDRGIYRPGDTVYAKGWLFEQTPTGIEPVVNESVAVRQWCGSDEQNKKVKTNTFGAFDAKFRISTAAKLGSCTISIGEPVQFGTHFMLEEYRRVEYLGTVNADQTSIVQNEVAGFRVTGTYLHGTPMRNAQVKYWTSYNPVSPAIATDFVTDAHSLTSFEARSDTFTQEARLDAHGQHRASVTASALDDGPTDMTLHAGVEDATHQLVGATARVLVHPASYYLGLRSHSDDPRVGGKLRAEVIAIDTAGHRLSGKRAVVELRAVMQPTKASSGERVVARCTVKTVAGGVAACQLPLTVPGKHSLIVSGRDEQGRVMRAGKFVWVAGSSSRVPLVIDDDYDFDPETERNTVKLTLDQLVYKPNDIAHAQIDLPWSGMELLVTVEADRVHWRKRLTAYDRRLWLNIPIPPDIVRSGEVVVYAAMGRRGPPNPSAHNGQFDPKAPSLDVKAARFEIDPNLQRLDVEVSPDARVVTPGAKVKVALRVRDRKGLGHKAEVTLFAVDEGVLALTRYQRPDPLDALLGVRQSSVTYADSRDSLGVIALTADAWGSGGLGLSGIGDGGGGSGLGLGHPSMQTSDLRKNFAVTPYFNAHIVTADDGTANVVVPLSDALTQFRLMAVAVTDSGESGSQEVGIQTRKPLMIRASAPRLLRVGDEATIGAIVANETDEPLRTNVVLSAQGVRAAGQTSQIIDVPPHQSTDVAFTLRAPTPGSAKVQLTATAAGYEDAVITALPVTLPMPLETVASYGQAAPRAAERLGDLTRARTDVGKLDVQVSSTALVGLDRSLEQLENTPYPCTEQLVSKILPRLLLQDLLRLYAVTRSDNTTDAKSTLKRILERQKADGGFALWPRDPDSDPWVSVYVLLALHEAIAHGFDIPSKAFLDARTYVAKLLQSEDPGRLDELGPFAAYVLNRAHALDFARLEPLWKSHRDLPFYGKALLLELLALDRSGGTANANVRALRIEELRNELVSHVHFDGPSATVVNERELDSHYFDSEARSVAFLVSALLEVEPKHPLIERLVRGLLNARKNGTWRSTQETSFALLAIDKYRRMREADAPRHQAKVWLNSHLLGEASQQGRGLGVANFSVPVGKLDAQRNFVEFVAEGQGPLYYEMRLDYAPKQLPAVGLDRGFAIAESLYRVDSDDAPGAIRNGSADATAEFKLGDVVTGKIRVSTPTTRNFVAVEVPLPAGFELVNRELVTTFDVKRGGELVQADAVSHYELKDDRAVYYIQRMTPGTYNYQYLARATSVGRFRVPPAQVIEMYAPEVFGRTGASWVTIK